MKDKDGKVMTDEESVLRIWKEYKKELLNEENEKDAEDGVARKEETVKAKMEVYGCGERGHGRG